MWRRALRTSPPRDGPVAGTPSMRFPRASQGRGPLSQTLRHPLAAARSQQARSKTQPTPRTPQPLKRRRRRKAAEQIFYTPSAGGRDLTALSSAATDPPMGSQATSLRSAVFRCPFAVLPAVTRLK